MILFATSAGCGTVGCGSSVCRIGIERFGYPPPNWFEVYRPTHGGDIVDCGSGMLK